MSIKLRLEEAATESDLHVVMRDVWAYGSRNWTRDAAIRFVPPALWEALDRYFDVDGRVLSRFPEDAPTELAGAATAELEAGESELYSPAAVSLSKLIASFHLELEAVRTAPANWAPLSESPEPTEVMVTLYTESVEAAEPDALATADRDLPQSEVLEPEPEDTRFLCPICETRTEQAALVFRGKAMCLSCINLLRGY